MMMSANKFDLSRSLRETLSMRGGRQSARSRGKAHYGRRRKARKVVRPLTARCGCHHEESVRSDKVMKGSISLPGNLFSDGRIFVASRRRSSGRSACPTPFGATGRRRLALAGRARRAGGARLVGGRAAGVRQRIT
jgi:hypothetical protein